MNDNAPPSRAAASPAGNTLHGWLDILKRTYAKASADNLGLIAAGVAFYTFLGLVPLLAALVLTYGLVVNPAEAAKHIGDLTAMVPEAAAGLIADQLDGIVKTSADKKGLGLLLALGLSLYSAMKGAGAIITALNVVYGATEARTFFRLLGLRAAMTVATVFAALVLLVAISLTAALGRFAGEIGTSAALLVKASTWAAAILFASATISALYRIAPNRRETRWRWVTPGSVLATLGVIVTSAGFGWYAAGLGNYNATYGSLGAVVILQLWLWLTAYVLMLGGALNAVIVRRGEMRRRA